MKPTEKNSNEEDKSNVEGILSVLNSGGEPKPPGEEDVIPF